MSVTNADCHTRAPYAECHYAECRDAGAYKNSKYQKSKYSIYLKRKSTPLSNTKIVNNKKGKRNIKKH